MKEAIIQKRIQEIASIEDKREHEIALCELHYLINDNEDLEALVSGWSNNKNWLVVVTNTRAFLYSQEITKQIKEIPIDRIKSIDIHKAFSQADLIINTDVEAISLTMQIASAKQIEYLLSCLMEGEKIDRSIQFKHPFLKFLKIACILAFFIFMVYYIFTTNSVFNAI